MGYPRHFLQLGNFRLAFDRIRRGTNKDYKRYYRHLLPSYELALGENLLDIIDNVKRGTYNPSRPCLVYQPKRNGILRPIALLSLRDLIVYQAILNIIARAFAKEQQKFALHRYFGSILGGSTSRFFYKSWKVCYEKYNDNLAASFRAGNEYVADFDLVSLFEIIDHHRLRVCLESKVKNQELLDLLFKCLASWTIEAGGAHLHHGIPQGPEPSAFLAECLLLHFDRQHFPDISYFRYVDDIRLMAANEVAVRRALLRLDLASKELGLVPQAQKINVRRVASLEEIQKTIPSALASVAATTALGGAVQSQLLRMFRRSMRKEGKQWKIVDVTQFKFSLHRLGRRREILQRIGPLLNRHPDCCWALAAYFKKFPRDCAAAKILLKAIAEDPIFDLVAANYIDALDVCAPEEGTSAYSQAVNAAKHRSVERSILPDFEVAKFLARRSSVNGALKLIRQESHPLVRGMLIHELFGDGPNAMFRIAVAKPLLEDEVNGTDEDLARFSASLILLSEDSMYGPNAWRPQVQAHRSVQLLLKGLGLRSRQPTKNSVLKRFFESQMNILIPFPWRKALGRDWSDAESRCLRYQNYLVSDITAAIAMLDTFNEVLLQAFSQAHQQLSVAYKAASGKGKHPDLGNWIENQSFVSILPKGAPWFQSVHKARVKSDLAHAKQKKVGIRTKPIPYRQAQSLLQPASTAWAELISEWKSVL